MVGSFNVNFATKFIIVSKEVCKVARSSSIRPLRQILEALAKQGQIGSKRRTRLRGSRKVLLRVYGQCFLFADS